MEPTRLGRLAVNYGFVTEDDLRRCVELQRTTDPPRYLGEVLLDEGLLKEETLERLLAAQRRKMEVGGNGGHTRGHKEIADRVSKAPLDDVLKLAVELNAQELHLVTGSRALLRRYGSMVELSPTVLDDARLRGLLDAAFDDAARDELARVRSVTTVHAVPDVARFRVTAFRHRGGTTATFTRIPDVLPDRETLELPEIVDAIPAIRQGLVLITGPRASGKTTTLASIVQAINASRRCHVVTIERPIEYVFENDRSLISQREVGVHTGSFAQALRSSLREDPDVIVVGDLSDPERIMTALTAAETGHLVLGTLQTADAQRTLLRILDAYSGERRDQVRGMLAAMLRVIISQDLVPSVGRDRVHLASEVLTNTAAVSNMIREDRIYQVPQVMQTSRRQGMHLLDGSLARLVEQGKVAVGEAAARAVAPDDILALPAPKGRKSS